MLFKVLAPSGFLATLIVALSAMVSGAQLSSIDLKPVTTFRLSEATGWSAFQVKEMKASSTALSFLIQGEAGAAIVSTDMSGKLTGLISLPAESRPAGLAVTERGPATVLVNRDKRSSVLVEYDRQGKRIQERPVSCYLYDELLTVEGAPATVCPDGTITRLPISKAPTKLSSWIRPGSLAEILPNKKIAIVDQNTAQTIVNDLQSNSIATISLSAPEIENAVRRIKRVEAQAPNGPKDPRPGRMLLVMDTAVDHTGWYLLLYPYKNDIGPSVVKFSSEGQLTGRFRCLLPNEGLGSIHKMEVYGNSLILSSVSGFVLTFQMQ